MRSIRLQGVSNVRDLGGLPVRSGRIVTPGLIFRGGDLSGATQSDLDVLSRGLSLSCIIDLRVSWEREAKPNKPVPGAEELHIPFFDKEIVGVEYEKPIADTRMRGHDFACDPTDLYRTMANPLTVAQMGRALREVLGRASEGKTVYFHCSGGKDRAGVLAALVLDVLGCAREDIEQDYLLTNVSRDAGIEKIYERFLYLCNGDAARAREVTDQHRARVENLQTFWEAVLARYGGKERFFFEQLGIADEEREAFRLSCTQPA